MNINATSEDIIKLIESRIHTELTKHKNLDDTNVSAIAARKIYSSLNEIYEFTEKKISTVSVDPEFEHIQEEYDYLIGELKKCPVSEDNKMCYLINRIGDIRKAYPGIGKHY